MYNIVIVLIVIASILMSLIVLIQESKGGGLASSFSSSNTILGVRKTTDVIEKTTWGLAIAMVLLSVVSAYLLPSATVEGSVLQKPNATTSSPVVPTQTQSAPTAQFPTDAAVEAPAAE